MALIHLRVPLRKLVLSKNYIDAFVISSGNNLNKTHKPACRRQVEMTCPNY